VVPSRRNRKTNWWRNSARVADILFFWPRDVQAHRRQSRSCAEDVNVELHGGWLRAWNRSGLEPETALRLLREEIFARFSVHDLPAELREELLVSTAGEGTMGGRVYDAHIAEIARQAGARLVATENRRHFTPLLRHGIRVLVSAELADEIGGNAAAEP
jgi:hypothetical protein